MQNSSGQNFFVPFNDDSLKIKFITSSFGNRNKYRFIHDQSNYLINIIFHENWETSSNRTHPPKNQHMLIEQVKYIKAWTLFCFLPMKHLHVRSILRLCPDLGLTSICDGQPQALWFLCLTNPATDLIMSPHGRWTKDVHLKHVVMIEQFALNCDSHILQYQIYIVINYLN